MDLTTIIIAIISAATGIASVLVTGYIALRKLPSERKQTEAGTAQMITKAAGNLVDDYRDELHRLRDRAEAYESAIKELQQSDQEKSALIKQLQQSDREKGKRIDDLERRLALAQARIKELEAQNRALKQENEDLRRFYEKQNGIGASG